MQARIKWVEQRGFVAELGSGHGIFVDAPEANGGRALGPSPMELVLMGAGACSAVDVVSILEKMRQKVTDCVVELDGERPEHPPRVFTRITMRFKVTGRDLDRAAVERAVQLSAEKYCSATIMLSRTAQIVREIQLVDA